MGLRYLLAIVGYVVLGELLSLLIGVDLLTSILQMITMAPVFAFVLFIQHVLSAWLNLSTRTVSAAAVLANVLPPAFCFAVMLGIAKSSHLSSRQDGVDWSVNGNVTREGLLSLLQGIAPFYPLGLAVCLLLVVYAKRKTATLT